MTMVDEFPDKIGDPADHSPTSVILNPERGEGSRLDIETSILPEILRHIEKYMLLRMTE
jgi:hypothetical protein